MRSVVLLIPPPTSDPCYPSESGILWDKNTSPDVRAMVLLDSVVQGLLFDCTPDKDEGLHSVNPETRSSPFHWLGELTAIFFALIPFSLRSVSLRRSLSRLVTSYAFALEFILSFQSGFTHSLSLLFSLLLLSHFNLLCNSPPNLSSLLVGSRGRHHFSLLRRILFPPAPSPL